MRSCSGRWSPSVDSIVSVFYLYLPGGLKGIADRVIPLANASSPKASKRVVSLGGSITETIVALGHKDALIGIDTTSVYPPNVVSKLPSVGYLRQLSTEGVLSLEPGVIIASDQIGPKTVVDQLKKSGVKIEMFDKDLTPESATKNIRRLGEIFGESAKADALVSAARGEACGSQKAKRYVHKEAEGSLHLCAWKSRF